MNTQQLTSSLQRSFEKWTCLNTCPEAFCISFCGFFIHPIIIFTTFKVLKIRHSFEKCEEKDETLSSHHRLFSHLKTSSNTHVQCNKTFTCNHSTVTQTGNTGLLLCRRCCIIPLARTHSDQISQCSCFNITCTTLLPHSSVRLWTHKTQITEMEWT